MPTREEAIAELYRRGKLQGKQLEAAEELIKRGVISAGTQQQDFRKEAFTEMAEEVGPFRSFLIGAGKGFYDVGRGLGLVDPAGPAEQEAMAALSEQRPYTMGAGEIVGQAAPFVLPGTAAGRIPSLAGRVAAGVGLGAAEGGVIAKGTGGDVVESAGIGGTIGGAAEVLFPIIGRLGGKVYRRVMGKAPEGQLLDPAGQPTPELQQALDASGMTFEDLTEDAMNVLRGAEPGADPAQVARQARFAEEGIPATKGDITQSFEQQKRERQIAELGVGGAGEPLRQFQLQRSEKIKEALQKNVGFDVSQEEAGGLIQDALLGRKKLMRSQKNELYEKAALKAKDLGAVPVFGDTIADALPSQTELRRLGRVQGSQVEGVKDLLVEFGIIDDAQAVESFLGTGGEVVPLNLENFEEFRAALNQLERADQSGATSVITRPIKEALDSELDDIDGILERIERQPQAVETDYRMSHTSPEPEGANIGSDLTDIYGDDIYGPNGARYYGHGDPSIDNETIDIIRGMKDSPDAEVTIFRAVPEGATDTINEGDWVTVNYDYADMHGQGPLGGDYEIIEKTVKAKEIATNGDSIHEWGYWPENPQSVTKEIDKEKLSELRDTLKQARATTRRLKTEFSPQSIAGRITDVKKDGVTQVTEASKVYSKLTGKGTPVEDVRKLVKGLRRSGEKGETAIASIQASTMLDLIDAGFGTESRKISGKKVFNPTAFKRRLNNIGKDKVKAIFGNNKEALRRLENIDKIASDLIAPDGAMPKGSAGFIMDALERLGWGTITSKFPPAALITDAARKGIEGVKVGREVTEAIAGQPDVKQIEYALNRSFPGIASAVGIAATQQGEQQ